MFLTPMAPSIPADPALAAVIRRVREERGETQEDLAFKVSLSVGAVGRIERGATNPTWMTVRRIARALDMPLDELGVAVEREEGQ